MFQSEKQRLILLIWGVVLFFLALAAVGYQGYADDGYWHVKVGEWIFTHYQIPKTGIFSYSNPDKYWTSYEWLSEVLSYVAFHYAGGWAGLYFLILLCLFTTMLLLLGFLLRRLSTIQSLIFVLFACLLIIPHIYPRPHIFAIPVMTYWTICLIDACERQTKPPFYILPLMILWVNMHGSFMVGIAFSIFFAAEAVFYATREIKPQLIKQWGLFIVLAIMCAAMTPHGIKGLLLPFGVFVGDTDVLYQISEFLSPNFQHFQPLEIWLLSFLALVLMQGITLPMFRLVFLLGLLHLSLKHVRYACDLLSVLSPLILASPLAKHWNSKPEISFNDLLPKNYKGFAILAFYFCCLFLYLDRIKEMTSKRCQTIETVLSALKPEQQQLGNVLNNYGMGDFLIYLDYRVFIDPRGEIYTTQFIRDFLEAIELNDGPKKLEDIIAKYHVTWTLFETNLPINTYLATQLQWHKLYSDKVITIYIHQSVKLSAQTLSKLNKIEKETLAEQQKTL